MKRIGVVVIGLFYWTAAAHAKPDGGFDQGLDTKGVLDGAKAANKAKGPGGPASAPVAPLDPCPRRSHPQSKLRARPRRDRAPV